MAYARLAAMPWLLHAMRQPEPLSVLWQHRLQVCCTDRLLIAYGSNGQLLPLTPRCCTYSARTSVVQRRPRFLHGGMHRGWIRADAVTKDVQES
jgi:hypothetical protein